MTDEKTSGPDGPLSADERARYLRHLLLPQVGVEGQVRLKAARVLLVGAGGLGSPAAMYLAAAGVGCLGLIDADRVDVSNLQRQLLHGDGDVGRLKTESARDRLAAINPLVQIERHTVRLTRANAMDILHGYDVIVDGTDNFPTRYLINDACVLLDKPMVYGSVFRFEGQVGVFWASRGACYRCLYPNPPPPDLVPSCAEAGVLGVLPGIIGCLQANEVIKLILGLGEPLVNRLLLVDALGPTFRELLIGKDETCPVCGKKPTVTELIDYEQFCGVTTPGKGEQHQMKEITVTELKQRLDAGLAVDLIDVREPHEFAFANIPHARLIPLATITANLDELNPARETVVMCRGGARSAKAIDELRRHGYTGPLINLKGGILAWSDEVDPSVPKY
jgi:adenylyltransferase/sulfurtransferase